MLVFTSITKSYLPKARVLAQSVKRIHPDWNFQVILSDVLPPNFNLANEPFDGVITLDDLGIPEWKSWAFGHTIVELCTAVKGVAGKILSQSAGQGKLMYLDPDIKVFNSLEPLEELLDKFDVLLTPHLLEPEDTSQAIRDNEISALKHGVFNLGFFAIRTSTQGLRFLDWWAQRLLDHCIDNIPGGLFTDQKWCDLAPCFFDNLHIVRDCGYNVATWNIAHRPISADQAGTLHAGAVPLRFYHFTGYDSGDGLGMLLRYAADQKIALKMWDEYKNELSQAGQGCPEFRDWHYGHFSNGERIPIEARRLYRFREDLKTAFPDPYLVAQHCFYAWWNAEARDRTNDKTHWQGLRTKLRPLANKAIRTWLRYKQ